ncbi:hypothetical protein LTR27_012507 [Elasticomyces elasticus]|nr:hypothetical protein LTR27_012507 [Elasticomyces elasticus]
MASGKFGNVKQISTEGYNDHAQSYHDWTQSRPKGLEIRQNMVSKLLNELGVSEGASDKINGLRVLELGCGAGDPITLRLAAHPAVASVVANDISSSMLAMLQTSLTKAGKTSEDKVEILEKDMMAFDFEPGTLDAVIGLYSLIHLEQEQQVDMVAKISRWLKPGTGHLLCCFASAESLGKVNDNWLGMRAFWSSLGTTKSLEMLKSAGLEVVYQDIIHEHGDAEFLWVIARRAETVEC